VDNRGAHKKKENNIKSIRARVSFLEEALLNKNEINKKIISSLNSQSDFSALSYKDITPMSLNTLKTISDEIIKPKGSKENGFRYLDSLRKKLKENILKSEIDISNKKTIKIDSEIYRDLNNRLTNLEISNIERSKAYKDLISKVTILIKDDKVGDICRVKLHNLVNDHKALYTNILSPKRNESSLKVVTKFKK